MVVASSFCDAGSRLDVKAVCPLVHRLIRPSVPPFLRRLLYFQCFGIVIFYILYYDVISF